MNIEVHVWDLTAVLEVRGQRLHLSNFFALRLGQIEAAFAKLGMRLGIGVRDAA